MEGSPTCSHWALGHPHCPGCAEPLPESHKQGFLLCLLLNLLPSLESWGFLPMWLAGFGVLLSPAFVLLTGAHSVHMTFSNWKLFLHCL